MYRKAPLSIHRLFNESRETQKTSLKARTVPIFDTCRTLKTTVFTEILPNQ
jgi:hypothetical protein